jgi:hypothetical protein
VDDCYGAVLVGDKHPAIGRERKSGGIHAIDQLRFDKAVGQSAEQIACLQWLETQSSRSWFVDSFTSRRRIAKPTKKP